jgi:tetratricopeptide (TPR) repeat protein
VQSLFEEGVLQRNGIVTMARPMNAVTVPTTVQAVLASRIDRLPPAEKELLQTLAVLGREFNRTLVQQVTRRSSDELELALSRLQVDEFIREQPAIGEVEYGFKHALTQEVAYNSLLIERRKSAHERTGEAMETMFAEVLDDHVAELAHHYDRSGNPRKAVEYLKRSAAKAAEQAAHPEVIRCVTRALEVLNALPDTIGRAKHELDLQMTLEYSMYAAVGPASVEREKALTRALALCEQLGDSRIIEATLSLSMLRWHRSEGLSAMQLGERALSLAELAKDIELVAAANTGMGHQLFGLGEFEKAREYYERAIEVFDSRPIRKFGQIFGQSLMAPFFYALTLLVLGYPTTAVQKSKSSADTWRRRSEPLVIAYGLGWHVAVYLVSGALPAVREQIEELAAITAEHEMPLLQAAVRFFRGWLTADGGQVKEGLVEMSRVVTQVGPSPAVSMLGFAVPQVCVKNGLADEGLAAVDAELAKRNTIPCFRSELYRLKGELTLLKDLRGEAEAESCLRQAIDIARRQAARLFELRATTSLARLLRNTGRHDEARTMLAEIYNWFTEGFDTVDLKDAEALLDQLNK